MGLIETLIRPVRALTGLRDVNKALQGPVETSPK